jgi:hypothetical protein
MTREGIEQIPDGEWEHTSKTNVFCPHTTPVMRSRPAHRHQPVGDQPRHDRGDG